jgi:hypothetical protein
MAPVSDQARLESIVDSLMPAVDALLRAVARRQKIRHFIRLLSLTLIGSSIVVVSGRLLGQLMEVMIFPAADILFIVAVLYLLPGIAVSGIVLARSYTPVLTARFIDQELGLKERLSTAVSLPFLDIEPQFADFIRRDAQGTARSIDPSRSVRLHWTGMQTAAVVTTVIALGLICLPISPVSVFNRSYLEQVYLIGEAENLRTQAQKILRNKSVQAGSPERVNAQKLVEISNEITHRRMDQKTVLAKILQLQNGSSQKLVGYQSNQSAAKRLEGLTAASSSLDKINNGDAQKSGHPGSNGAKSASGVSSQPKVKSLQSSGAGNSGASGSNSSNTIPTLGDKLRQFANRIAVRKMTSGELSQAADSLDDVNHKLDNLSMPRTQAQLTVSTQDLRDYQQTQSVIDIRKAAFDADTEGATPPAGQDGNGSPASKNAVSVPEKGASSGANAPSSEGQQSQSQQQSGQGNSSGTAAVGGSGQGGGAQPTNGPGGPGKGDGGLSPGGGSEKPGFGAPRQIDPSKLGTKAPLPPIALPISNANGRHVEGNGAVSAETKATVQGISTVAYQKVYEQYQQRAEKDVSGAQIPHAYKDTVRKYFSSLPGEQK